MFLGRDRVTFITQVLSVDHGQPHRGVFHVPSYPLNAHCRASLPLEWSAESWVYLRYLLNLFEPLGSHGLDHWGGERQSGLCITGQVADKGGDGWYTMLLSIADVSAKEV